MSLADFPRQDAVSIAASSLMVDHAYHRAAPTAVARFADTFNPELERPATIDDFPPLLVTHRANGRYAIIDGAIRFCGLRQARRRGWVQFDALPCVVITVSDRAEEARLSISLNADPDQD